ncbi:MAG: glycogen synthase [Endomicrobiia bacterium]
MKIVFASFECVPFVKVGGLADVVGSLPKFLKQKKVDVRVIIPLHSKKIDKKKFKLKETNQKVVIPLKEEYIEGKIWQGKLDKNIKVYLLENDRFFGREEVYATSEGDYEDNPLRFIFFSRGVLETLKAVDFKADIIHCHDMQTGLIPAYLKTLYSIDAFFQHTKSVFTIHNIAYQGLYDYKIFELAGFAPYDFTPEKFEYYGKINFMKSGIVFSDIVTTVSPTYAKMVCDSHIEGRGLEGVLSKKYSEGKVIGILNGIDYNEWNPETDEYIKANYNIKQIEKKSLCKEELQKICEFKISQEIPLYGMVSRIDPLKGFDLIIRVLPKLLSENEVQVVILGKGKKELQEKLQQISKEYKDSFRLFIDFNNPLGHKIYAAADFFLMPSSSEPCGLSQMIAMRYATIPIVYKTGGLVDTVEQFDIETKKGCGFIFEQYNEEQFYNKILQSIEIFHNKEIFKILRINCMQKNFSWDVSAKKYIEIYDSILKGK